MTTDALLIVKKMILLGSLMRLEEILSFSYMFYQARGIVSS